LEGEGADAAEQLAEARGKQTSLDKVTGDAPPSSDRTKIGDFREIGHPVKPAWICDFINFKCITKS
jgi:hypothetical protein